VVGQVVERVVGGGEHVYAEAPEQLARPELRGGEDVVDGVVDLVGGLGAELLVDAEDGGESLVEPVPGGGPVEQVPVPGESAPDLPGWRVRAEVVERHTRRVEQPGDVVVLDDEQVGRVRKGCVEVEQPGRHVAVRRDDRVVGHALVQRPRDRTGIPGDGKQPMRVATLGAEHAGIGTVPTRHVNRLPNACGRAQCQDGAQHRRKKDP
jgi:hypothetical protein